MAMALGLMSMTVVIVVGVLASRAPAALRRYGKRAERAFIIGIGLLIGVSLLISLAAAALQSATK